jgi:hypothetical protein
MPGGVEATDPAPSMSTVSVCRRRLNRVVTTAGADAVRVQVSPEHAEPKPSNVDDAPAVAVSITSRPAVNLEAHVPGQSMPGGRETMRPDPVPAGTTSMMTSAGGAPAGPAVPPTGSGARPQARTANTNAILQLGTVRYNRAL